MRISETDTFEFHSTSNLVVIYCKDRFILQLLNQLIFGLFLLSERIFLVKTEEFKIASRANSILCDLADEAYVAACLNA